jgi:hypothetical protein
MYLYTIDKSALFFSIGGGFAFGWLNFGAALDGRDPNLTVFTVC